MRNGQCRLGFARLFFSGTEICNELGVSSTSVQDATGRSILEILESETRICCRNDALRNEPRYSFVYPIECVSCAGDLLQLIDRTALGVTAVDKMNTYAGFESDLRELGARGDIYYLYNSESKRGVGFRRDAAYGSTVDADILELWNQAAESVSGRGGREIERELYSLGINATKVAPVEKCNPHFKDAKRAKNVNAVVSETTATAIQKVTAKKCKRKAVRRRKK